MLRRRQRSLLSTAALAAVLGGAAVVVPAAATDRVVVVQRGDTLSQIAVTQGVSVAELMRLNGIVNPNRIQVGQRILVAPPSASATPSPSAPAAVVHRVASGENLTLIAQRYGTTIGAMVKANGIGNPSFLRVGQLLTIPGAATSAGSESAMPSSMAALVTARDPIRQLIAAEATAQGVPVAFALALAWQESGWQPTVVSSGGAVGVMQLTPPTADWVASTMLDAPINLADPASNARAGVRLLRHYFDRYGGDRVMVLAAYYQGQTGADRHGVYPMTRPYIASILALEAIFSR